MDFKRINIFFNKLYNKKLVMIDLKIEIIQYKIVRYSDYGDSKVKK